MSAPLGGTSMPSAPPAATVPEALQAPPPGPEVDTQTPFAVGDIGWMNGNTREQAPIFDTGPFAVNGKPEGDGALFWTTDSAGHLGMSGQALF